MEGDVPDLPEVEEINKDIYRLMELKSIRAKKNLKVGPNDFYQRARIRFEGSDYLKRIKLLTHPDHRKAAFLAELCRYPDDTEQELLVYNYYIESEKKLLPFSGGILDQPAWVMQSLNRIDQKMDLVRKLVDMEDEDSRQDSAVVEALNKIQF